MADFVFERDGKWYFWDETWAEYHGPYATEELARRALNIYTKYLELQRLE